MCQLGLRESRRGIEKRRQNVERGANDARKSAKVIDLINRNTGKRKAKENQRELRVKKSNVRRKDKLL